MFCVRDLKNTCKPLWAYEKQHTNVGQSYRMLLGSKYKLVLMTVPSMCAEDCSLRCSIAQE